MAKTQAEYIEEQNRAAQAETEKRWKQREEQDAAYIAANNSAVDQSTAAALKPYETRMEQLPEEYRKQYDYNAVEELVRQKQVAETMANLGLTDSGLNRTQQTAIAVSRGNADAAARLSQQEKTQELQDKMDQLKATGEIQKQQTAAEVKANSQAWLNNLQSAAYENAAILLNTSEKAGGCFALQSKNRMNTDHKGGNGWIVKYIHIPKQRRARISRGIVMRGERGESFTGG